LLGLDTLLAAKMPDGRAENGTVVWLHEQDICPDTLYEDSEKLVAPTEDRREI
jgi:hypothetical protein